MFRLKTINERPVRNGGDFTVNIIQITPGAGKMFCGNCFRDNALVAELRGLGHEVLMVPLYLPLTLDEEDQSAGTPLFFNGVNIYLGQGLPLYRRAPGWIRRMVGSGRVLKWAATRAGKTRAEDVGDLTISMLRGEEGNQARELSELIDWLKTQPRPDIICLSNSLLLGLADKLRSELGAPMVCLLQNEAPYIDSMPDGLRDQVWDIMAARARDIDCFIAPSRYYADKMEARLGVPSNKMQVIHNGINLDGFEPAKHPPDPPALGFFSRMCRDKGLDAVVDAFISLRKTNHIPGLKLRIGGGCGPGDKPFVDELRNRLHAKALLGDVEFHPNLSRAEKQEFLRSLSVLSVPAQFGEAYGFYIIEAMAAGVPVVQPHCAAFPELLKATGGGLTYEPTDRETLAASLETFLHDPAKARQLGQAGRAAVHKKFSIHTMAQNVVSLFGDLTPDKQHS